MEKPTLKMKLKGFRETIPGYTEVNPSQRKLNPSYRRNARRMTKTNNPY